MMSRIGPVPAGGLLFRGAASPGRHKTDSSGSVWGQVDLDQMHRFLTVAI